MLIFNGNAVFDHWRVPCELKNRFPPNGIVNNTGLPCCRRFLLVCCCIKQNGLRMENEGKRTRFFIPFPGINSRCKMYNIFCNLYKSFDDGNFLIWKKGRPWSTKEAYFCTRDWNSCFRRDVTKACFSRVMRSVCGCWGFILLSW